MARLGTVSAVCCPYCRVVTMRQSVERQGSRLVIRLYCERCGHGTVEEKQERRDG